MTAALELATKVDGWRLTGRARIDNRPPVPCTLLIRADGTWSAGIAQFTFADTVDLLFESDAGGQFCGPAYVDGSRVDTHPFGMRTGLTGTGPLLVVAPDQAGLLELGDAEILDAEVVE